jgi:hypothetical protein
VLLVVGLGIAAWFLVPNLLGGGETTKVPSLEGQELAAARQKVGDDFELVSSEQKSAEPKGTILSQDPKAGSEAPSDEKISVAVSSGPELVAVPDVVGKDRREAEEALRSEGFEVKAETRQSSEGDAGKVLEQTPPDGEAQKGSEVAITVGAAPPEQASKPKEAPEPAEKAGPAPGYNLIKDPTGGLTVEVPPSWGVDTAQDSEGAGANWSGFAGDPITSSITTAPSLAAWYTPGAATGAYIVASRELAQTYTDDELIFSGLFSDMASNCATGPYEDFERPPYQGQIQTYLNCASGKTFHVVSAAPEGRECVVVLQLAVPAEGASEADRKAIEHILDTFSADCGRIA